LIWELVPARCVHKLIPILAMAGVLFLFYGVVSFSFISCRSYLLKFKSLCTLEQQPWSLCSLSLRSRPTYHGPCQTQNCIFHTLGTAALIPSFYPLFLFSALVLISANPSLPSIFVRFPADSHLSQIPIPLSLHIYRSSLAPPSPRARGNACLSVKIPSSRSSRARAPSPSND
jgi:hypothetical protein